MIRMDEDETKKWKQMLLLNFAVLGQDPRSWLNQAQLLKTAADEVSKQAKIGADAITAQLGWVDPVYRYLAGITIENLLKGIIVADHPEFIREDGMVEWLAGHQMWTKHADQLKIIKLILTKEEENLLRVLEHYVMWVGRYPIAVTAEAYAEDQLDILRLNLPAGFAATFDALYNKLSEKLGEQYGDFDKKRAST